MPGTRLKNLGPIGRLRRQYDSDLDLNVPVRKIL
jgi:hypothetical protein